MKQNTLPDKPMFDEDESSVVSVKLSLEDYRVASDIDRQNKTLDFCFDSLKWVLIVAVLLIIADIILQHSGLDNTLLKNGFSLLTYVVTTALGFVFANNTKK